MPRCACLGLAIVLLAAAGGSAQTPEQVERAHAVFAEFGPETPGAAAIVVREGRVVFRAGYGMANLDHGVPIGPETVFDVASVSKQFGAMAIAMLAESGEVDLDAQVRHYLPELPDFGHSLTVRHLVHHTSGIRDWPLTLAAAGWRFDDVISFDQILRMAWSQRELNFPPGTEYSYSNTGYNLLAEIVQRVSGQSFRAWTEAHMFGPLGMASTHFSDDHTEVVARRAQGYNWNGSAWLRAPNGLTALGSSSLHSSADDLARWLVNYDTHAVGGSQVVERMRTRGVLDSGDTIPYAYGISRNEWRGRTLWSHTGSWAGDRTVLVHFPEIRSGVVILANVGHYNPTPRAQELADIFLGDLLGPVAATEDGDGGQAAGAPAPEPSPRLSADALAAYVGTWVSDELDTRYVLRVIDGQLVAEHFRHGAIPLTPSGPDAFESGQRFFRPVRFERRADGSLGDMLVGEGRARNLRFVRR